MSKTKSKGTFAESAVANYLNEWCLSEFAYAPVGTVGGYVLDDPKVESSRFPLYLSDVDFESRSDQEILKLLYSAVSAPPEPESVNWQAIGHPFDRANVGGSLDRGDVLGPFTSIEVKNHANPVVGTLLNNAEWKSQNSGRPLWSLVWKAKGKGLSSVGHWHTAMTLEALVSISDLPEIESADALYELDDSPFEFSLNLRGLETPRFTWSGILVAPTNKNGLDAVRDQMWNQYRDDDARVIPFIISPRRGSGGEEMPVNKWFAYTKLYGFARVLETLGVLPQDVVEYTSA